jgi:hypothetical protein
MFVCSFKEHVISITQPIPLNTAYISDTENKRSDLSHGKAPSYIGQMSVLD